MHHLSLCPPKGKALSLGFSEDVKLTNLRASVTMLTYAALISIPAAWSFTRRDVS